MTDGIRKERAHGYEYARDPSIREMPGVPGQGKADKGNNGQRPGLRSDHEMAERCLTQLTLDHEKKARSSDFSGLVTEKHQTELMSLVYGGFEIHNFGNNVYMHIASSGSPEIRQSQNEVSGDLKNVALASVSLLLVR